MKTQKLLKANRQQADALEKRELKIKVALFKKGITQKQIADELEVTHGAISAYITGKSSSSRFNEWVEKNLGIKR